MTPWKSAHCLCLQVVGRFGLGYKDAAVTHSLL